MTKTCTKCKKDKEFSEFHKDKQKRTGLASKCKECFRSYQKKNKARILEYERRRRKENPHYKIAGSLRSRVRQTTLGICKSAATLELLGCSLEELKEHLEQQFTCGMSWDNYGKWHIDHVRPCASFDLQQEEEQRRCFHYSNLQPLWAKDNWEKGDRYGSEAMVDTIDFNGFDAKDR